MNLGETFRRRMGLRTGKQASSYKHTDWAHENYICLLGAKGRMPLPVLSQVLTCIHFLCIKALSHVSPLLVKHYPHVRLRQWAFGHGELQAHRQPLEFKLIPLDG